MSMINQLLSQLAARLMPCRYRRNQLSIRAKAAMLASERPATIRKRAALRYSLSTRALEWQYRWDIQQGRIPRGGTA